MHQSIHLPRGKGDILGVSVAGTKAQGLSRDTLISLDGGEVVVLVELVGVGGDRGERSEQREDGK